MLTTEICHAMKTDTTKPKTPRNRVGSRELVSLLSEWEGVAFGHESVFLERFCHDAWQLVGVYWCSEKMEVVYVLDSGQHVTDSIPLNEWLEFYEANTRTETPLVGGELVSCPFCGSDKIMCEGDGRSEMAWMCCQKCLAQGPAVWTRRGLTSKSARVRWNERAANIRRSDTP